MDKCKSLEAKKKAFIEHLMGLYYNKKCADCSKAYPSWASVTFSFFVCYDCAAQHRKFGVLKSKVKSTQMDDWNVDELRRMYVGGNKNAYKLPENSDFNERYRDSQDIVKEIDELAKKSEAEEPGVSFLELNNKSRGTQQNTETSPRRVIKKSQKPKFSDFIDDDDTSILNPEPIIKDAPTRGDKNLQDLSSGESSSEELNLHHVKTPTANLKRSVKPSRSPFCFSPDEIASEDDE